jgi:hypothetical protein
VPKSVEIHTGYYFSRVNSVFLITKEALQDYITNFSVGKRNKKETAALLISEGNFKALLQNLICSKKSRRKT